MKIEDLMPYDFVRYRKNKQVVKVFEVDADRDVINTEFDGYNGISWIHISDLEPIPLTTEILRKNDWYQDVCGEKKLYFIPNKVFYLVNSYQKGYMSIGVIINGSMLNLFRIQYIHEVQHILRICNLTKLANNLKI